MRIATRKVFVFVAWALSIAIDQRVLVCAQEKEDGLAKEEARFWNRFLQADSSLSVTDMPSETPSVKPSAPPTSVPSTPPSEQPTSIPSTTPSEPPTSVPSGSPSEEPTSQPSAPPTSVPSGSPSEEPTSEPSSQPSSPPTIAGSNAPSAEPSAPPSAQPSSPPTSVPSAQPTSPPTSIPSVAPSEEPTSQPSTPPTSVPSNTPSGPPTSVPSNTPSEEPTSEPSAQPTSPPTIEGSIAPSSEPTAPPSSQPTSPPTLGPSSIPSEEPSEEPSAQPSSPPSPAPTPMCVIPLDLDCVIQGGAQEGLPCDTQGFGIEPCLARPTSSTMLYNGGTCEQSDQRQGEKFSCQDFNGGPSFEEFSEAYIVVTDAKGRGVTYFEGFVRVGENFRLSNNEERFEADQIIRIFNSSDTSTDDNILQVVQYHSSCSSNLELLQRFGASQLTSFVNEVQGNVSVFGSQQSYDINISIPFDFPIQGGTRISMTGLTVLTNFLGFLDLSDQVAGQSVGPGDTLTVNVNATVDASVRRQYTFLVSAFGTADPGMNQCEGTDFLSFYAGSPKDPIFPTAFPTRSPTVSPAPTPDPQDNPCDIESEISCVGFLDGRESQNCERIPNPLDIRCQNGQFASGLFFLYEGTKCPTEQPSFSCRDSSDLALPDTVFITAESRRSTFTVTAQLGQTFAVFGDFSDGVEITVSSVVDNGNGGDAAGTTFQTIEIDASCDDPDAVVMGRSYGAVELVGFENSRGSFRSLYEVQLRYVVENMSFASQLNSAFINSEFQPAPEDVLPGPEEIGKGERKTVFRENIVIDFAEKSRNGVTFQFAMNATGVNPLNNLPCFSQDLYSF